MKSAIRRGASMRAVAFEWADQSSAVRGDLRYFRQLSDIEFLVMWISISPTSRTWRGTVGLSFGF